MAGKEGELGDWLLIDGDPIANINLVEDPAKNFLVIMKDGQIVRHGTLIRLHAFSRLAFNVEAIRV